MKLTDRLNHPIFALGFRVFFTLAGLSALILIALWNAIIHGSLDPNLYFFGNHWHGHEMILGYGVAVISGFLLTAVKNWTGKPTPTGAELAGLSALWLSGRIAPFCTGLLPDGLISLIDFSFLPILAYCVSQPIVQAKQYRNLVFVALLLLLALGNGLMHIEFMGLHPKTAKIGIDLTLATVIIMILIIAGRVFPFFTERGLPGTLIIKNPGLDHLSIASAAVLFTLQLLGISGTALASSALFAVIVHGARLSGWYTHRVWSVPLLWVLYSGYAWIIIGFILTLFSAYSFIAPSLTLHAFTLGGIGVLTLGMMARVSLGHTGRPLKVSKAITTSFVLINISALLRVLLPIALPKQTTLWIDASAYFWLAAFILFCLVYLPILTRARMDGQPG